MNQLLQYPAISDSDFERTRELALTSAFERHVSILFHSKYLAGRQSRVSIIETVSSNWTSPERSIFTTRYDANVA